MNVEQFENKRWAEKPLMKLEEHHKHAAEFVNEYPYPKILSVGEGDGTFLTHLITKYHIASENLLATDLSPISVKKMRKRGLKAQIWDFNNKPPFRKNQFDYVVLLEVLEHTLTPIQMLKNVSRCGRTIIISVPNFVFMKDRIWAMLGLVPPEMQPKKGHSYWMTKSVLANICENAGLTIQQWKYYFPDQNNPNQISQAIVWLMSWWPSLFSTMYVVKCKKK